MYIFCSKALTDVLSIKKNELKKMSAPSTLIMIFN